ncbi:MAG: hypothetical protein ABI333_08905 [bacterium]
MAAIALAVLGLLWITLRLYWQGLILLTTSGLLCYFGFLHVPRTSETPTSNRPSRAVVEPRRRSGKRKRRK